MADFFGGGQSMAIARLALDAYTMRHQAIAANIANVHSENFRPLRVNFEEQLANFDFSAPDVTRKLSDVAPFTEEAPRQNTLSPAAALDMEVVRLNQNTLAFQALITAMGKSMSLLSLAAREGRV
jgi:flagellar basal-body rod protein FlgB